MELDLLDKKIRRLVCKLKKHNVDLEVFEHDDIEYGEILGKGGEGIVQRCTVNYNGLPVDAAAKTVLDSSDDAISITLDEIELLCLAKDPIISTTLRVYGVAAIPDETDPEMGHLVIITEAGLMNALQLYQRYDISLAVTYQLWSKMAAAVHMMQAKNILHHDIKPENILITQIVRNHHGQIESIDCKIIDMGMGKRVFTEKVVTDDILGTNGYHPPEVLMEESYDFRADIFMLGVTFCVMLYPPYFLKKSLPDVLKKLHGAKKKGVVGKQLFENHLEQHIEHAQNISPKIKKMLCKMLEQQEKRTEDLVDIVDTCREEAALVKEKESKLPPQLSPFTNCPDSGFSSTSNDPSWSPSLSEDILNTSQSEDILNTSQSEDTPGVKRRPRRAMRRRRGESDSARSTCSTQSMPAHISERILRKKKKVPTATLR